MHRMIILGEAWKAHCRHTSGKTGISLQSARTVDEAVQAIRDGKADILLVGRDFPAIELKDLTHLWQAGSRPAFMIWPPDDLLTSLCNAEIHDQGTSESVGDSEEETEYEHLVRENRVLSDRITTLEAAIRSLVTALSHYDLSYEAFTGDDAWQLIMDGLPAAERMDAEPYEDEYDEEMDDGTDGN